MGALDLSKDYFFKVAEPLLKQDFSELYPRLAVGLVGNGSDRFGFDDQISKDHDWGIDFYLWTTDMDKEAVVELQNWKQALFRDYPPTTFNNSSDYCLEVTAMTVGDFYHQLIGSAKEPQTIQDWTKVPEEHFALATNGAVWFDGAGEFTKIRMLLLEYYPEDLRRKRMAAKCMEIAQTGQYNYLRMAERQDWVAVKLILARFSEAVMALVFMLNKVYRPYYKWVYKKMCTLPILGDKLSKPLLNLALAAGIDDNSLATQQKYISLICNELTGEILRQGLATSDDCFMVTLGEEIQKSIVSDNLRNLPAQFYL